LEQHNNPHRVEAPQEKIASIESASKTLNSFGLIIFFVIVAEVVLLFGLNLYQESRTKSLNNNLTVLQSTLSSASYDQLNTQVEEVISGKERLELVLNSKARWSKFYSLFNSITPKNILIKNVNISNEGSFKADGETTSLTNLAKALVAWNGSVKTTQSPFTFIKLSSNGYGVTNGQKRVTFSVTGQINLGILR